jgi:hypothetical protein
MIWIGQLHHPPGSMRQAAELTKPPDQYRDVNRQRLGVDPARRWLAARYRLGQLLTI